MSESIQKFEHLILPGVDMEKFNISFDKGLRKISHENQISAEINSKGVR